MSWPFLQGSRPSLNLHCECKTQAVQKSPQRDFKAKRTNGPANDNDVSIDERAKDWSKTLSWHSIYCQHSSASLTRTPKLIRGQYTLRENTFQDAIQINISLSPDNIPPVRTSDRDPCSLEMLRIPEVRDENGQDLLSECTILDKSGPETETKWTNDIFRAFDHEWHDPAIKQLRGLQTGRFSIFSSASSWTTASQSR